MPKSTVSAKVAGLERRLGVSLLKRTTRKLHVTPEGDDFFRSCAKALGEIEAAEAAVASGRASPKGIVSMTAPAGLGHFLAVFLRGFLDRYPEIEVDLILTNRYVDLVGEGVDLALRAGELKDSTLVARRINTHQRGLVASPSYLEAAGALKHPDDLPSHAC